MKVDKDQIIELLLKYKNQVTFLVGIILCLIFYALGANSVHIPHKNDVCQDEFATISSQFAQLGQKDKTWTANLRKQRDEDELTCQERIKTKLKEQASNDHIVSCEEACILFPQCERAQKCPK